MQRPSIPPVKEEIVVRIPSLPPQRKGRDFAESRPFSFCRLCVSVASSPAMEAAILTLSWAQSPHCPVPLQSLQPAVFSLQTGNVFPPRSLRPSAGTAADLQVAAAAR